MAPGDSQATHDRIWHQRMRTSPLAASHRRRAQDRPQLLIARQRYLTLRYEIDGSQPSSRELRAPPAREPAEESAQHESDLGRERNVAGHADEDAERQPQYGANRGRGSDAHVRESTFALAAR